MSNYFSKLLFLIHFRVTAGAILNSVTEREAMVLPLQGVGGAALVSFDVEEAFVGFEKGGEAGAGQTDFLEDHGRGDFLPSGEDLGELGLDLFIGDLRERAAGAFSSGGSFRGFGSLRAFGG